MYVCEHCIEEAKDDPELAAEVRAVQGCDGDSAPEGECNVCGG